MKIYRKIYEQHYGQIPKDSNGRSYEIHHINGDHSDNRIENLKLVTIEEHYQIHQDQEDWGACFVMLPRMKLSPTEISKKASENAKKGSIKRIAEGTHNFLDSEFQRQIQLKRIAEGTHNFLDKGESSKRAKLRVEKGTHNFLNKLICPHCDKKAHIGLYNQWHGDKCKWIKQK